MAAGVARTFRFDLISLTLKFGLYQKRIDYLTDDPSGSLVQRLYQDAERWIYELVGNLRNASLTGSFKLQLCRLSTNASTIVPITRTVDIEQNSLIEIILVPMETNRRPHMWDRYSFTRPTYCVRCSRFIAGLYKQGSRCRLCRMTAHHDCAPLVADDCRSRPSPGSPAPGSSFLLINPIGLDRAPSPPISPPVTPRSPAPIPIPPPESPVSTPNSPVIDRGIFPACLRGSHIYRRYAFFLTRDTLSIAKNLSSINGGQPMDIEIAIPLSDIQNIILTHFVPGHDDVFEIHLLDDRDVISVGRQTDSDEMQMETAQFYSSIRDQWEALINTTPSTSTSINGQEAAVVPRRPLTPRPSNYRLSPQDGQNQSNDLHDLYVITGEKIGGGQFGRVISAYRKSTQRPVAVKIIEKTNCDDRQIELINGEINHLYKFNHMNILKLEAYFERNNAVYLVTERMETDLCKYILRPPNGYLDENTSRMLIYQVIIALRYLHENNCGHLDVKCENILLTLLPPIESSTSNGPNSSAVVAQDYPLVKLADFGYSKIIGEHSFRKSRVGTKVYNAPEIYRGEGRYNRLVDMWSIGVVLYASLSGTLPYSENDIQRIEEIVSNHEQLFSGPRWSQVSREAKDLIANKLLVVPANSRNRPNDALFHDWFTDYTLFQNLREIERRTKSFLRKRGDPLPNAARWLTDGRADIVWNEYKKSDAESARQNSQS